MNIASNSVNLFSQIVREQTYTLDELINEDNKNWPLKLAIAGGVILLILLLLIIRRKRNKRRVYRDQGRSESS